MTTLTSDQAAAIFRRPPERFIDVGDGAVGHRSIGSGPDVLFVHGWPVSGATFRTLLPFLSPHVTCHVIDLPGAGDSRFTAETTLTIERHSESVRTVVDQLGLEDVAVVGHDSGGLIARYAFAGDGRVRAMGLIDTEQPEGFTWRFKQFLIGRRVPGFGAVFGRLVGAPRLRRNEFVLGGAFTDRSLLDGEFDEFFLQPIRHQRARRDAAMRLLSSFDESLLDALPEIHSRIDAPVQLVWGERDPFLPVAWARSMVDTFPDAKLEVIADTRLFCHEERPAEVAAALLPVLASGRHDPRSP